MDESELRRKARQAIDAGGLPKRRPDQMWGGPGTGKPCAVCGEAAGEAEMAFEMEFAGETASGGTLSLQMHRRCCAAWELERDHALRSSLDHLRPGADAPTIPASECHRTGSGSRK